MKQVDKTNLNREHEREIYIVGTNDGTSPRTHVDVISVIHSIADSAIPNTFLSTFKFLQQSEVSWDCKETHACMLDNIREHE